MRQQIEHGQVVLAPLFKAGQVPGDGIGQCEAAPLGEQVNAGRRGDWFRQRGEIEDRIDRHRHPVGFDRAIPKRLQIHQPARSPTGDHAPRQLPVGNRPLDPRGNVVKHTGVEPRRGRVEQPCTTLLRHQSRGHRQPEAEAQPHPGGQRSGRRGGQPDSCRAVMPAGSPATDDGWSGRRTIGRQKTTTRTGDNRYGPVPHRPGRSAFSANGHPALRDWRSHVADG